jgi:hypothetical protein
MGPDSVREMHRTLKRLKALRSREV